MLRLLFCLYRSKGSELSVNPGAAGSPPELPWSALECSQYSPVCPVHEYEGQSGDITAALQSPGSDWPSWATSSSSSTYACQASPASRSCRSTPYTPNAQASLTPYVCAVRYSRRRGCCCHADGHDDAAGSASPGSAGSKAGTWWQRRRGGEYKYCRRGSRRTASTFRGQTASRAQPSLSR